MSSLKEWGQKSADMNNESVACPIDIPILSKGDNHLLFIGQSLRQWPSSISGWVLPKTQKMVLNISLLNTQHYKVQIKGKVEQSKEKSSTLPCTSV